ncbi:hypothetical protein V3390_09185 [Luteimonas sp. FXH3W]|uniref:Bacteriophage P22, Gp10, DNA-stabilising n=1 Tax=Aquilutibacter rugosus TaxID=3115820 RepID=A0ABU7V2D9_9GAMM
MKSNFLGQAYAVRSLPLASQTCVNLYPEVSETGGAFYGTPGKRLLATLGGPIRGLLAVGPHLYCVAGNAVVRLTAAFAATTLATLPSNSGAVGMAFNNSQVVIAHPDGWTVIDLPTGTVSTTALAPATCDVTFIDNYGVAAADNGTYVWTSVANFGNIDALAFASAEGSPDKILSTLADHRELWLMGESTIEVAQVGTDPDLPFTRTTFIEQGILAPKSAVKQDNSVFWLGRNDKGQGVVYRADGYTPVRISTHAIELAIGGYANPESCTAYTYQQDGHHFVCFNFDEATWAYDINTQAWHQRAYRDPFTGALKRDRAEHHALFAGQHIVGDWEDGRLYALDMTHYLDGSEQIYRERTWRQFDAENRRMVHHRLELLAENGIGLDGVQPSDWTDPQVWLSWSNDGGRTWSSEHSRSLGKIGEYLSRIVWWRLGTARSRDYRIRTTAAVPICLREVTFQAEVCSK